MYIVYANAIEKKREIKKCGIILFSFDSNTWGVMFGGCGLCGSTCGVVVVSLLKKTNAKL